MDTDQLHIKRIPHSRSMVSQECNHEHLPDSSRTGKPILQSGLYLLMDGIGMEVWVQGSSVYTELLDDSVVQKVEDCA